MKMLNSKINFSRKKEYVSFSESDAIKGILILLIILGHNHYLVPEGESFWRFLYGFHVTCFFILPFFYNKKKVWSIANVKDIILKCYLPYFFFFVLCAFIYLLIANGHFDFLKIFYAFINGSYPLIKENVGFTFLWFLPAFCAFSILKIGFDNSNKVVKLVIVALSVVLVFYSNFSNNYLFPYIPFAITQGFFYFAFGFITWFFVDKIPYIKYLGAVAFIILSFIFFWKEGSVKFPPLVFPVVAFMFFLSLKEFIARIPYLQQLGKFSFAVYLVHVIIYNVLEKIFVYSVSNAVITYILTILLSIVIAFLMTKISFVQKLILPKGYNDFKSLFVK